MPANVPYAHRFRAAGGSAGAPASLLTAELAVNMQDGFFYYGFGDDGNGNATSVKSAFNTNRVIPAGGAAGQYLRLNATNDGLEFAAVTQGGSYTAGSGIDLTGNAITVDATIARLASPTFTGTVTVPTPTNGDNTTKAASTAFVTSAIAAGGFLTTAAATATYAPLASPALTGTPTAPTAAGGTNTTQIATTAFVTAGLAGKANTTHTHSAADITSGTLDPARLPASVFQAPVVTSSNIAGLTAPEQASITTGTFVVTSDGRLWAYNTGSKTSEASYIEVADKTPDWSQIASKPSFAAVATSGSYNDLSNKPTLGTLAAQNASAIAVTGGSMSGVTLSNMTIRGGTF